MKLSGFYDLRKQCFCAVMINLHVMPFDPLLALIWSTDFIAGVPKAMIESNISRVQKIPRYSVMDYCVQANGNFPT